MAEQDVLDILFGLDKGQPVEEIEQPHLTIRDLRAAGDVIELINAQSRDTEELSNDSL